MGKRPSNILIALCKRMRERNYLVFETLITAMTFLFPFNYCLGLPSDRG